MVLARHHARQSLLQREQVFEVRPQLDQVVVQTAHIFVAFVHQKIQVFRFLQQQNPPIHDWNTTSGGYRDSDIGFFVKFFEDFIAIDVD